MIPLSALTTSALPRGAAAAGLCFLLSGLTPALAEEPQPARILFGAVTAPTHQPPDPIGSYARGCAAGMVRMPESGPTWQLMRLSRDRFWGQPETLAFLQDLSAYAATLPGWKGLYIGDISQPRGGPMTSSHASHQTGLEADIWMRPATRLDLSRAEREKISSVEIRSDDQTRVTPDWTPAHMALIRHAAEDPRVDRIFIAAAAKIAMCNATPPAERGWLQKIRPYYGHSAHIHVRLKCPPGATDCVPQTPTVAELSHGGSGCDASLNWWVTTYLDELKTPPKTAPAPARKNAKTYLLSDLPPECRNVLASR